MYLPETINKYLHDLMAYRVMRSYKLKAKRIEREHPELFKSVDSALSDKHRALWSKVGLRCDDRWLRFFVNLTGIPDYTFCPADIFYARVERVLNDCNQAGYGPEEKNDLLNYLPRGYEPETIVRFVRGVFFDGEGNWLSKDQVRERLRGEFIGKPCRASGGSGVELRNDLTPEWIMAHGGESYVVQKKIEQCAFAAQFNPFSINTVRMVTMRCPWNGEIVVCRSIMRIGVSNAVVDNMSKGGLCVCLGDDGQFARFAYDYNGKKYEMHPVSMLTFAGLAHPGYAKMVEAAKKAHSRIMAFNLLSFDLVERADGSICIVEVNATSQGIIQVQYGFGGLFGENSERVVDWCARHVDLDRFSHFRTWY